MHARQAAFLTSRLVALWFAYNVVRTLLAVPSAYLLYSAFESIAKTAPRDTEYFSKIVGSTALSAVDVVLQLGLALFFYRAGPRVIKFFTGKIEAEYIVENLSSAASE